MALKMEMITGTVYCNCKIYYVVQCDLEGKKYPVLYTRSQLKGKEELVSNFEKSQARLGGIRRNLRKHGFVKQDEEYEIETILKHRVRGKKDEFFVKWKGYGSDENLWIPRGYFNAASAPLLKDFLNSKKKQSTAKRGRKPRNGDRASDRIQKSGKRKRPATNKGKVTAAENLPKASVVLSPPSRRSNGQVQETTDSTNKTEDIPLLKTVLKSKKEQSATTRVLRPRNGGRASDNYQKSGKQNLPATNKGRKAAAVPLPNINVEATPASKTSNGPVQETTSFTDKTEETSLLKTAFKSKKMHSMPNRVLRSKSGGRASENVQKSGKQKFSATNKREEADAASLPKTNLVTPLSSRRSNCQVQETTNSSNNLEDVILENAEETVNNNPLAQLPGGLILHYNNCFANSVIQLLYTVAPLKDALIKFNEPITKENELASEIRSIFQEIGKGAPVPVVKLIRKMLTSDGFNDFREPSRRRGVIRCRQSDAQEFMMKLLDNLRSCLLVEETDTLSPSLIDMVFSLELVSTRTNVEGHVYMTAPTESISLSSIISPECADLHSGLSSNFNENPNHELFMSSIEQIVRLPSHLLIQLNRLTFNPVTKLPRRLNYGQEFPLILDMAPFCAELLKHRMQKARQGRTIGSFPDDPGSNATGIYELQGVISHGGQSALVGHYIAWTKHKIGTKELWLKCNDQDVAEVDLAEVLSLSSGNEDGHIAYMLLYGPTDSTTPPISSSPLNKRKCRQQKKPTLKTMKKRKPTHRLCKSRKIDQFEEPEDEWEDVDPQENEKDVSISSIDFPQRESPWEENPTFPITADQLAVWKVGEKASCSFLLKTHWVDKYPEVNSDEWQLMRDDLTEELIRLNVGYIEPEFRPKMKNCWRCRQCCVYFGNYDGFMLHLKCHHFPSGLMTDDEQQAAVICVENLKQVEIRDSYYNPVAVLRCQFLIDCYQQNVIDKNFNIMQEARAETVFHTWVKKRGLRIPEIAQLKSTFIFPELNDAVWDVYRVKNWKFSKGSESLQESDLRIAAETTYQYIQQMKQVAKSRGKIYTFLLVPTDLAATIKEVYAGDATKFLEEYNGNSMQPLVVIVGKTSSTSLHSRYHFQSYRENSSYTRNLLETGKYTLFRISSVPFKNDSNTDYQRALAEQELAQILYVKMCISYMAATNSKFQFVDHQKVEGRVLRDMLQKCPTALSDIMETVVKHNGQIFSNNQVAESNTLQIVLCNSAKISLDKIRIKKGTKSMCPDCGYFHGSKRDQTLHKLLHNKQKSLTESSTVDHIFSFPRNFSDKNEQEFFFKYIKKWQDRHQHDKPKYFCYLLALDKDNDRNKQRVFQRLTTFLSDIEFRKQNSDMFWFYVGKNSTTEGPSGYHASKLSSVALTARNSYSIKTWKFESRQQQEEFEASFLLFAEKSEELDTNPVHFINKRLEFTAFESPLSLEKIRQIYSDVNNRKGIFTFKNKTANQEIPSYYGNQLDEASFSFHLHGSYNKKKVEIAEPEKKKEQKQSGITFAFHCKACDFGFTRNDSLFRHYSTCEAFKQKYPDEAAAYLPRSEDSGNSTKCSICHKVFSISVKARKHFQYVHQKMRRFKCTTKTCFKMFYRKRALVEHERIHTGVKPYTCRHCKKGFTLKKVLTQHELIHKGVKPYKCGVCGNSFLRKYRLTRHELIHKGVKPYKCGVCGNMFSRKHDLTRHELIHKGVKPFNCGVCGNRFSRKNLLTRHELIHKGVKPYKCGVCGNRFLRKYQLTRHELIHTGVKAFKCGVCGNSFSCKYQLTRHELIHTGVKPFKCEVCGNCFSRKYDLTRHEIIHKGVKPFKCEVCGNGFSRKAYLVDHKRIHSGVNPYRCENCGKRFSFKKAFIEHKQLHTDVKPYKCTSCSMSFARKRALTRHQVIHTGEKPYKCRYCSFRSARKSNVKRHELRKHH